MCFYRVCYKVCSIFYNKCVSHSSRECIPNVSRFINPTTSVGSSSEQLNTLKFEPAHSLRNFLSVLVTSEVNKACVSALFCWNRRSAVNPLCYLNSNKAWNISEKQHRTGGISYWWTLKGLWEEAALTEGATGAFPSLDRTQNKLYVLLSAVA